MEAQKTKKQTAGSGIEFAGIVNETKKDLIAELNRVLDGYGPGLRRMALIAMLTRMDIQAVDDDIFVEELGRRWGGLPDNAKKGLAAILGSPSVMRHKRRKLKLAS